MKQLLGIALILAIGLVVSHRWFGKAKFWGLAHLYYLTGEEFLLLGLLLGPSAANLVDPETLTSLEPFVGLGLGYIGFVFGMQFRYQDLVTVPGRYYVATVVNNLVAAGMLLVPLLLALRHVAPDGRDLLPFVLALIATAVGTSTSFLFILDRRTRIGRSRAFQFMKFSSVFDDLWGVLLFGVAVCLLRQGALFGHEAQNPTQWLLLSVGVGVLSGSLLLLVARMELGDREILLFLLGMVLFSGGLATHLELSPIFTNMVAGIFFCNLSGKSDPYHDLLLKVEKPIYLFMLVLGGAMWRVWIGGLFLVVAVYVLFRTVGKYVGGQAAAATLAGIGGAPSGLGLGLTAQSEMSVAMMVNLLLLYQDDLTRLTASSVFIAVVVNDLASSSYFSHHYKRI